MNQISRLLIGAILAFLAGACDISENDQPYENDQPSEDDGLVDTLWTRSFGGSQSDIGRSVQQTSDGGFIITGSTRSFGAGIDDVWLIKTDMNGFKEWDQTFGGSGYDQGYSVQQTRDGGYILTGSTQSDGIGSMRYAWLIKTDAEGNEEWNQIMGPRAGIDFTDGRFVQQTTDGGFFVTGTGGSAVWLIKTDSEGNEEWSKAFSDSLYGGNLARQTTDGGFVIVGGATCPHSTEFLCWNVVLIKTDAEGNKEWTQNLGGNGTPENPTSIRSVKQTLDGGFILVGNKANIEEPYSEGDVWLIKISATGEAEWEKTFGGDQADIGRSVQQTMDGGYIVTGSTHSFRTGESNIWIIKTDAEGNEKWNKIIGGTEADRGNSIQLTSDGGYVIVGYTKSYGAGYLDVWLVRVGLEP